MDLYSDVPMCECGHGSNEHRLSNIDPDNVLSYSYCIGTHIVAHTGIATICSCNKFTPLDWITDYCIIPERIDSCTFLLVVY